MTKKHPSLLFLLLTGIALTVIAPSAPTRGQIPTHDASVIPQLMQTAQTLSQQLAQIQAYQAQIQGTIRALGGLGSLPQQVLTQLIGQLNPMPRLANWTVPERSCALDACGDFLKDNIFIQRPGVPPLPSSADFNVQREYIETRFFSPTDLEAQGRQQVLDERGRAARAAARDGYAMALAARGRLAQATQDAQYVLQVGGSGTTMREDIQRLSAVLLAIYQERQQQLALYAALLEVEGSSLLAADPNVVSPRMRAPGGAWQGVSLPPTLPTSPIGGPGGGIIPEVPIFSTVPFSGNTIPSQQRNPLGIEVPVFSTVPFSGRPTTPGTLPEVPIFSTVPPSGRPPTPGTIPEVPVFSTVPLSSGRSSTSPMGRVVPEVPVFSTVPLSQPTPSQNSPQGIGGGRP